MSEAAPFLTIEDLAKRWAMPVARAKERVKCLGVPYIRLDKSGPKISWKYARFRPADIEDFEGRSARTTGAKSLETLAPVPLRPMQRRRGRPSKLWG